MSLAALESIGIDDGADDAVGVLLAPDGRAPYQGQRARWTRALGPVLRRRRVWWALLASAIVLAAAGAPLADEDSLGDLINSLRSVAGGVGSVRWQFLPVLVLVAALHYACAAVALRAAAGARLPMGATILAQLAASSANRLTPAGLGGAAVNVRFLTRDGRKAASAVSAVTALGVLGAIADLLLLTVVVFAGGWIGLAGGHAELTSLGRHLGHIVTMPRLSTATMVAVAALGSLAAAALVRARVRRRRRNTDSAASRRRSARTATTDILRYLADMARRPRDLALLLAASAGTTFMMGVALAVSVNAIPGAGAGSGFGVIISAYLLGAAAGSAVPTPAGIGSTEATLVAALIVARVPASHALQSVLLFRLITFWAPAIAGLPAARALRARGSL